MSDPTIQTFCCYTTNTTDVTTVQLMEQFSPDAYNAICLFSSTMGIIGAIYQILPRRQYSRNHRWVSFSAERGRRIILWLAFADLFASLGIFVRALLWINVKNIVPAINDSCSVLYCVLLSAWIQYFYIATWIWTLCYAIDMRFLLCEKEERVRHYHIAAWTIPAFLTAIGLTLLYFPDANCHMTKGASDTIFRILPNYIASYIPIGLVMITNPWLYSHSCKDMEKIITCTSGQFTRRERDLLEAIKIKFSAINVVFYMCWCPNLVSGILLWCVWFQLPVTFVITTWYMMAFMNPLQALFNTLVYRRWNGESEMVVLPWTKTHPSQVEETNLPFSTSQIPSGLRDEHVPLLQQFRTFDAVNFN